MNGSLAAEISEFEMYLEAFTSLGWAGHLEGAADGIFQQVINPGKRQLSPKQKAVIESVVHRFIESKAWGCSICGALEADDVDAYLDCGLCSYHRYHSDRD